MIEMFKGVANSPETTITNNISNSDTLIYVLDETRIPEPPNLMVLGTGVGAETIKVLSIEGNAITVERGFQGVAKNWNAGTIIARNFTEYDYNALVENVNTLKDNTDTNADGILDLISKVGNLDSLPTEEKADLVLALSEVYNKLVAHKAENVSEIVVVTRDLSLSGTQIVEGFSKVPKRLDILCVVANSKKMSVGNVSSNAQNVIFQREDGVYSSTSANSIYMAETSSKHTRGTITINPDNTISINWATQDGGAIGSAGIRLIAHYHGGDE